jgi:pilus assembly protein CpaB
MQKYQKLLILFAFLFALLTTFVGYKLFLSLTTPEEETVQLINVPIAADNLDAVTEIDESHIGYVHLPVELVKKLNIITDKNKIVGKVLLSPIDKDSPFSKSDLLDEENDIPFHLPEEYRAITIEITPEKGVGGYISEGMYVDVLWTYERSGKMYTTVPFENVKILAVGSSKVGGNLTIKEDAKTITIMLTPKQAQQLTLMTNTGSIKLMLRSSPIIPSVDLPPVYIDNVLKTENGGLGNGEN